MSWLALFSGYGLNQIHQPYEHFSLKHWLALLPHLRTDALCQQPYNRIQRHSLKWWIKWNAKWYWKFDAKGELCIRYWRKDSNCNISLKTFLGKGGRISEFSRLLLPQSDNNWGWMGVFCYTVCSKMKQNKCGFYLKDFVAYLCEELFKDLRDDFSVC